MAISAIGTSTAATIEPATPALSKTIPKSLRYRSRAWVSILLLCPVGAMVAFSTPRLPIGSWHSLGFGAAGWLLFLSGALTRWWATLFIGGRKGNELVCGGPYSMTRNPLYFGTFLMLMSIPTFIQSLTLALTCAVVSIFYLAITVPREERRLLKSYGEAFTDYCKRVPKFFPRFSLYQPCESINIHTAGLRSELLRSLRWASIPFLCQAFVQMRMQPWWPHWFTLV